MEEGYSRIVSFYGENIKFGDGGDLEVAVEKATQKAENYLDDLQASHDVKRVKVLSMSTQSVWKGNFAAYTITMVLEIVYIEDEEEGA